MSKSNVPRSAGYRPSVLAERSCGPSEEVRSLVERKLDVLAKRFDLEAELARIDSQLHAQDLIVRCW